MLKKILAGTSLVGLIGILVFGAINRTMAKTEVTQAHGQGRGQSTGEAERLVDQEWGGYGRGGTGRNPQWDSDQGRESAPGDQTGTGQAQVEAWLQLQGTVVSVDADALVVETPRGEQVVVQNRPWWFAQEQGFSAQVGDQVTLTGFYEGDEFEVGHIEDATNSQTISIRDASGRPLWAGRGRRGA